MDTKLKGDIAEQAAIFQALNRGWGVLKPIGDRLPYDLVFDLNPYLVKIQVKAAWYHAPDDVFLTDNRRTKTNRRIMKRAHYQSSDFDFALVYLDAVSIFYVFPSEVFIAYGGAISLVESTKRQRKPRSADYRDAWMLISTWAAQKEISVRTPVKFGEASGGGNPEPSFNEPLQNELIEEGVET